MEESKFYSPLKIGLFIVTLAYFLFTFHAMFTLSWWGEWESLGDSGFWIYLSDITATFGLIFRLIASSVALGAMIYYFVKKNLPQSTATKILRCVLVAEAVYWAPLIVSAVMGFLPILRGFYGTFAIGSLISMGIPCLVAAIALPYALIKLAISFKVKESGNGVIKWGLIAGTIFVLVLWLNNMGMWIYTILVKGIDYLLAYPENLVSFVLTTFGLLALLLVMVNFARKSFGIRTLEELDLRVLGAIIVALGLYFLWNYLSWIIFDTPWSAWYAWFLGHNLDLWLLSIPLIGLPLLFRQKTP
jgi:hypothetical protein